MAVTIYLSGNVDEVVAFLEENGGDPRNVGEDYVEAYVPVPLLGPVSERPGVIRVREIIPPEIRVGEANRSPARTRRKDTSARDDGRPGKESGLRDTFGNATGKICDRKLTCSP